MQEELGTPHVGLTVQPYPTSFYNGFTHNKLSPNPRIPPQTKEGLEGGMEAYYSPT